MTNFLLTSASLIGLALLVGVATLLLLWLSRVAYEAMLKSRVLAIVFMAIIAVVVLNPKTAFIAPLIVFLWFTKLAYDQSRAACKRVGPTVSRLAAAQEIWGVFFLFVLACLAMHLSVAFAAVATLIVWPLANAVAKRREWPQLMRTAGR